MKIIQFCLCDFFSSMKQFALQEEAVPAKAEAVSKPEAVAKPDTVSKPEPDSILTPVVAKETPKAEPKSEAKSSRSGRLIKKTKYAFHVATVAFNQLKNHRFFFALRRYLLDEFEESPTVPVKRKRPSESQTPVAKIQRKVCNCRIE